MPKIDHEHTDEIVCPWCGHETRDSREVHDDDGEETCEVCDKEYAYTRYVEVTYSTEKKEAARNVL